ncbi:unnamed protein product [Symbiodinium sp. CCMP2592]|nr:unnamed protein product [Symbiodinium sp. CCMP2592]
MAPAEDAEAPNAEIPISILKVTCIKGPHLKQPWLPDVQTVGGVEYIKLHKWDRDLTLFSTGTPLNFAATGRRPAHNINVQWFEDTKRLRREACDAAVRKIIADAAEAEGKPVPPRIRPAREEDQFLVGKTVMLDCPDILDQHDQVLQPARQIQFLWGTTSDLFMELNEDNLAYIRCAIKESAPFIQQPSKRRSKLQGSPKRLRKRGRKPKADEVAPEAALAGEGGQQEEDDAEYDDD